MLVFPMEGCMQRPEISTMPYITYFHKISMSLSQNYRYVKYFLKKFTNLLLTLEVDPDIETRYCKAIIISVNNLISLKEKCIHFLSTKKGMTYRENCTNIYFPINSFRKLTNFQYFSLFNCT